LKYIGYISKITGPMPFIPLFVDFRGLMHEAKNCCLIIFIAC